MKIDYEVVCYKKKVALDYTANNQWFVVTKCHRCVMNGIERNYPIVQFMFKENDRDIKISTNTFLYEEKTYCGSDFGDEISEEDFQKEFADILERLKDKVINFNSK